MPRQTKPTTHIKVVSLSPSLAISGTSAKTSVMLEAKIPITKPIAKARDTSITLISFTLIIRLFIKISKSIGLV